VAEHGLQFYISLHADNRIKRSQNTENTTQRWSRRVMRDRSEEESTIWYHIVLQSVRTSISSQSSWARQTGASMKTSGSHVRATAFSSQPHPLPPMPGPCPKNPAPFLPEDLDPCGLSARPGPGVASRTTAVDAYSSAHQTQNALAVRLECDPPHVPELCLLPDAYLSLRACTPCLPLSLPDQSDWMLEDCVGLLDHDARPCLFAERPGVRARIDEAIAKMAGKGVFCEEG